MEESSYLLAGQFRGGKKEPLGISLLRIRGDGSLTLRQTIREDIAAGWICTDPDRGLVYAIHAKSSMPGRLGGGSCVYTFRLDPEKGRLEELGAAPTLSAMPSYVCLDAERRHLIVSHNGGAGSVTRIVQGSGGYRTETVLDDAALTVLNLDADGVPTDVSDLYIAENEGEFGARAIIREGPGGILANPGTAAHLHCGALSPNGKVLLCSDFGQGFLHSFRYDGRQGKLIHVGAYPEAVDCGLRYIAFHPSLPMAYINCENRPVVLRYFYDPEGGLTRAEEVPAAPGTALQGCRDLIIDPAGRRLYLTGTDNSICVMEVRADGAVSPMGKIPCLGNSPRTLALAGKRLYCGCNRSDTIELYDIQEDGMLSGGRIVAEGLSASSIKLFSI